MSKKSYFILFVAFIILLAAIFLYQKSFARLNEYTSWVNHSRDVMLTFVALSGQIKSAQIIPLDPDKAEKSALIMLYRNDIQEIPSTIRHLRYLVRDNSQQLKTIDSIGEIFNSRLKWLLTNSIRNSQAPDSERMQYIMQIEELIDRGVSTEKGLLIERKTSLQKSAELTNVLIIVFITISLLLIIFISLSNFHQISKRQRLELFLESVLNTSQNGIITYEAIRQKNKIVDFRLLFINDAVAKNLSIHPEEIHLKTLLQINPGILENGNFEKYVRVTESGKRDEFETASQTENSTRWYHVVLAKLNDGFTSTFHDITDLKNYQHELQKKVELLEHNNSELEQFAYVASHDLQEPLRKIKTFASLIRERSPLMEADFFRLHLNKVIESADRMGLLISDLLNLSSLSAEENSFVSTDLNQILKNVINDFELIIQEKKAVINSVSFPVIEAIPLQMNQLFYNLINNALKFSLEGRPVLINIACENLRAEQISLLELNKEASYYKITISDNGIGFNNEYAKKIFIIFQRLNNRRLYAGSGIGLALCRKIVLNHQGYIYAEAKEGEGATFHVILPETHQP